MKGFLYLVVLLLITVVSVTSVCDVPVFEVPIRPEGATEGPVPSKILVSQILTGEVLEIDVADEKTKTIVKDQTEGGDNKRQAWGLWYDNGYVFVAHGGPTFGEGTAGVSVYNYRNGRLIVTCEPLNANEIGQFMNDVTVLDGIAYITDSYNDVLMTVDVDEAISGTCIVGEVSLPESFAAKNVDDFGANGIVPYKDGLLVADEVKGEVWYISNLANNPPDFQKVIQGRKVITADGLTVEGDFLYVTQNFENLISVWLLSSDGGKISASRLGELSTEKFAVPAVSALALDGDGVPRICAANTRFDPTFPPEPTPEQDDVVCLDRTDFSCA